MQDSCGHPNSNRAATDRLDRSRNNCRSCARSFLATIFKVNESKTSPRFYTGFTPGEFDIQPSHDRLTTRQAPGFMPHHYPQLCVVNLCFGSPPSSRAVVLVRCGRDEIFLDFSWPRFHRRFLIESDTNSQISLGRPFERACGGDYRSRMPPFPLSSSRSMHPTSIACVPSATSSLTF